MKGAYLIAEDESFADDVWAAMRDLGAVVEKDFAQVIDGEQLVLMIEGGLGDDAAWDWREGPFEHRGPGQPPEMHRTWALSVECRSEQTFSDWMRRISRSVSTSMWVLDGDGVVWPADQVDPLRVRL